MGVATTSAPHESFDARGRPDRAAAARTAALFAEHRRTVTGLCRALLRDAGEAEDATQQTFLSAHRALLNGSRPQAPAAWLATIARNECWARISARMREPLPSADLEPAGGANDALTEALRRADLVALWRAIEDLPRPQRDALLLREFGGLSYEELAAALATSEGAVESLLFRARRSLRANLRSAYAALTGASWLETLARMLAGGGPPVAAKVAVLGVGAAALGSGAVVVPHVFDNHRPSRAPAVVHHEAAAPPAKAKPAPLLVAQVAAPVPVAPPPLRHPVAPRPSPPLRSTTRSEDSAPPPHEERQAGDHHAGPADSSGGAGEHDGEQANRTRTLPLPTTITVPTTQSGDAAAGTSGDGTSGGGDGGGSGTDGSGGSDGGGGDGS
jgi:RNA polymerase sigma factor (sigma-70 family)